MTAWGTSTGDLPFSIRSTTGAIASYIRRDSSLMELFASGPPLMSSSKVFKSVNGLLGLPAGGLETSPLVASLQPPLAARYLPAFGRCGSAEGLHPLSGGGLGQPE